jgi:hypothetical protein
MSLACSAARLQVIESKAIDGAGELHAAERSEVEHLPARGAAVAELRGKSEMRARRTLFRLLNLRLVRKPATAQATVKGPQSRTGICAETSHSESI